MITPELIKKLRELSKEPTLRGPWEARKTLEYPWRVCTGKENLFKVFPSDDEIEDKLLMEFICQLRNNIEPLLDYIEELKTKIIYVNYLIDKIDPPMSTEELIKELSKYKLEVKNNE